MNDGLQSPFESQQRAWDDHNLSQLKYFRSLALRDKLKAVQGMADVVRRFQQIRALGGFKSAPDGSHPPASSNSIREPAAQHGSNRGVHDLVLSGCRPEPLMNYLKALGILRLVSEQADPMARGSWRNDEFVLRSTNDRTTLLDFFRERYQPTPIIAPWGARSGFYAGSSEKAARTALEAIMNAPLERMAPFQKAVLCVRNLLNELGISKKARDEEKLKLLIACRQRLPDALLSWLDACYVLTSEKRKFPPLLGTGGNEGSGSYVSGFARQVVDCVIQRKHDQALEVALFARGREGVTSNQMPGHFSPNAAGGVNAGQGFDGPLTTNAWDYLLCLEGACLWASGVVRRFGQAGRDMAAFPFTVNVSGAGAGSIALSDSVKPKQAKRDVAEIWLPLWTRLMALNEVKNLLAEGRATIGARLAETGVDFARAVAGLGVDRGITSFQRNAFLMRNGQSFLCIGTGRFTVRAQTDVNLLREIDFWLTRFRRACKVGQPGEAPARFTSALRRIDAAIFGYCRYEDRDNTRLQPILIALGRAERELMRDGGWAAKHYIPPLSGLSSDWIMAVQDRSPEFDLALGLAGVRGRGDIGSLRSNLEPARVGRRKDGGLYASWVEKDRAVVWNAANLGANLAAVLTRRVRDAHRSNSEHLPMWSSSTANLDAIAAFTSSETDDRRLEELLWGLMLVDQPADIVKGLGSSSVNQDAPPLTRLYALFKPLFLPAPIIWTSGRCRYARSKETGVVIRPEPRILPLLRAGRTADAARVAMQRLRSSGLIPMAIDRTESWGEVDGERLAGALLFPIDSWSLDRLLRLIIHRKSVTELEGKTA